MGRPGHHLAGLLHATADPQALAALDFEQHLLSLAHSIHAQHVGRQVHAQGHRPLHAQHLQRRQAAQRCAVCRPMPDGLHQVVQLTEQRHPALPAVEAVECLQGCPRPQLAEVGRMSMLRPNSRSGPSQLGTHLSGIAQFFMGIGPNGLQQTVPNAALVTLVLSQQAVVDQLTQNIEHGGRLLVRTHLDDALGGRQGEAPAKETGLGQRRLGPGLEQAPRPVQRPVQGLGIPTPGTQQAEAFVQTLGELIQCEDVQAGCRQLDGQR